MNFQKILARGVIFKAVFSNPRVFESLVGELAVKSPYIITIIITTTTTTTTTITIITIITTIELLLNFY